MKINEKVNGSEPEQKHRGSYVKAELMDTIYSLVNLGFIYAWTIPAFVEYTLQPLH